MSYCRIGNDSDLYLFKGFNRWVFYLKSWINGDITAEYKTKSIYSARRLAIALKNRGVKVPPRAIDRLTREIKEMKNDS